MCQDKFNTTIKIFHPTRYLVPFFKEMSHFKITLDFPTYEKLKQFTEEIKNLSMNYFNDSLDGCETYIKMSINFGCIGTNDDVMTSISKDDIMELIEIHYNSILIED